MPNIYGKNPTMKKYPNIKIPKIIPLICIFIPHKLYLNIYYIIHKKFLFKTNLNFIFLIAYIKLDKDFLGRLIHFFDRP